MGNLFAMKKTLLILCFSILGSFSPLISEAAEFILSKHSISHPLNHQDRTSDQFDQRFFKLIPNNAKTSSPVLFVVYGEGVASEEDITTIYKSFNSSVPFNFILLEHRGYGESLSLNLNQTVPSYISVDQVLSDTHALVLELKKEFTGPFIGVGWSYAGGLVISHAARFPNDFKVILSSSGIVDSPKAFSEYDKRVVSNLGSGFYQKLAHHVQNLLIEKDFDQNWKEREFLLGLIQGLSQYKNYSSLKPLVSTAANFSTASFLKTLHTLDNKFAGGQANQYGEAGGKLTLTRDEALTGKYSWRTFKYQQCSELGLFQVAAQSESVFTRTEADYSRECKTLFGNSTNLKDSSTWPPRKVLPNLKTPLVFVRGSSDPWADLGISEMPDATVGVFIDVKNGLHGPDRNDSGVMKQVLAGIQKYLD